MSYKILFVDDEPINLRLLERVFRNSYEVITAGSAQDALDLLSVHDFALIISDQRMPGITGIDFLKRAAEMRPQTVRIMLTGYTDANALVEAINSGVVYKYITKPWINEDLEQTVKRALQHYETTRAQRSLQLQNERLQSRLKVTRESFVEVVTNMLELKEPQSRQHASRTSKYAVSIGEKLGLERPELEQLGLAALLHEAALFRIPNHIILKETPLTPEELQIVNLNLEPGLQILESVPDLEEVVSVLRFHYEHFDGSGQPNGFAKEQIPLHARIISVANAYDGMRNPRTICSAMSHDDSIRKLKSEAGRKFDPNVVEIFCDVHSLDHIGETEPELVGV